MEQNNGNGSLSKIFTFMILLGIVSALTLSSVSVFLQDKQEKARYFDRVKEMFRAAKIEENGDLLSLAEEYFQPFLVDREGKAYSFEEKNIRYETYQQKHAQTGYANLPLKLIYKIVKKGEEKPSGYIIPIFGYGLWDHMYGFLALKENGVDVIGVSWYEQKETPGLGGVIAESEWQQQFQGKQIFQADEKGVVDLLRSPIGITVVKGKVQDTYGKGPRSRSAVDGIAGATLTGQGVTKAYKDTLEPYRPFFETLQ